MAKGMAAMTETDGAGLPGAERLIWSLLALVALAVGIGCQLGGTAIVLGHGGALSMFPLLACLGMGLIYRRWRPMPRLGRSFSDGGQLMLILLLFAMLSYPAAEFGGRFPFRDAWLVAADGALGFDWHRYVALAVDYPSFAAVLKAGYRAAPTVLLAVPLLLAITGRRAQTQRFMLALILCAAMTLAIFAVMPARGAYAYFGIGLQDLHGMQPTLLLTRSVAQLEAMRAAGPHVISLGGLEGLVAFPSFHTAGSLLIIWALWPLRRLRPLVLAVNLLSIAATPVDGAHYFSDVLGGAAVAFVSVMLAVRWAAALGGARRYVVASALSTSPAR